jgi:DNA-binding CsgD family transcriptional regulator
MTLRVFVIAAIVLLQVISALFFISDILSSYVPLWSEPLPWEIRELLEISAAAGLAVGVVFGVVSLWRVDRQRRMAEERLRRASGVFSELLQERFEDWKLTPAEKDVALFALKGLSTAEIATLRGTSEGTVKAQTNAIYRKAGVANRPQLLSLFIEDLMRDDNAIRTHLVSPTVPALPPPDAERAPTTI